MVFDGPVDAMWANHSPTFLTITADADTAVTAVIGAD